MTPIEAVAKAIAIANWHNDPERPFTDAVWERELRWWRDPDNQIIKESFFADRCFRQARGAILALAEAELPASVTFAGHFAISGEDGHPVWGPKAEAAFRSMLRSIAQTTGEKDG